MPEALWNHMQKTSVSDVRPDFFLGEIKQSGEQDQEQDHDEAALFTLGQIGIGRPHQEGRDVLGLLFHGRFGAIIILDQIVGERRLR